MRKDDSNVREYAKHTRNAGGYGKRGVTSVYARTSSKPYAKRAKSPRELPVHHTSPLSTRSEILGGGDVGLMERCNIGVTHTPRYGRGRIERA
jgi:hypothetical protein